MPEQPVKVGTLPHLIPLFGACWKSTVWKLDRHTTGCRCASRTRPAAVHAELVAVLCAVRTSWASTELQNLIFRRPSQRVHLCLSLFPARVRIQNPNLPISDFPSPQQAYETFQKVVFGENNMNLQACRTQNPETLKDGGQIVDQFGDRLLTRPAVREPSTRSTRWEGKNVRSSCCVHMAPILFH